LETIILVLINMGLFSSISKSRKIKKESEWRLNLNHVMLDLTEDYIRMTTSVTDDIVFFKDIIFIEQIGKRVNFRTNVKSFSLKSKDSVESAVALHQEIIMKMSQNK